MPRAGHCQVWNVCRHDEERKGSQGSGRGQIGQRARYVHVMHRPRWGNWIASFGDEVGEAEQGCQQGEAKHRNICEHLAQPDRLVAIIRSPALRRFLPPTSHLPSFTFLPYSHGSHRPSPFSFLLGDSHNSSSVYFLPLCLFPLAYNRHSHLL